MVYVYTVHNMHLVGVGNTKISTNYAQKPPQTPLPNSCSTKRQGIKHHTQENVGATLEAQVWMQLGHFGLYSEGVEDFVEPHQ